MSDPGQPRSGTPPRYTRRPGDRVVRRAVLRPEAVTLAAPKARRRPRPPALVPVLGFAGVILVGAILLSLPIATTSGRSTPFIDALFTATSAVSVTGLVVVDTGTHWNAFGQAVVLALIQIGGLGFMATSTLLLMLVGRRATLRDRMALGLTMGTPEPGGAMRLLRRIALMTLIIESVGVLLLFLRFTQEMPPGRALWWGLFHGISAFNQAGFDIVGGFQSMIPFQRDPWILLTMAVLITLGGIGYTPLADVLRCRTWRRLTVDTKLVLSTTAALLAVGMVGYLIMEWNNPATLGHLPWGDRLLNGYFQSVTPRTAGFNAIPIGEMRDQSLVFTIALMFIGGASGSTAGGVKVQTFSLLFFAILAAISGRESVVAFGREIPPRQIYQALAVVLLAIAVVFLVALGLTVFEPFDAIDVAFETVSGFGTVGLSTGITPQLGPGSRLFLIAIMFTGRLGPLTLALALAARPTRRGIGYARENVKIG
ncbi:TrkH family potassium uptake protein [Sphaerobacter thermophilus]|uniref:TrkH family potassium uptake protein n=1 Tax=Sphaerobacter thermophilus TaxID=2057 RepID=UPI000323A4D8|nr:TrkH family potassium uptake protein [Sphaerobacter thermophilus]